VAAAQSRPLFESLLWLWEAGLRFASVINVGCAEGYFSVALAEQGPARFSRILNVDALEEYRESLEAIREAIGAQYAICALDAEDGGTVELHRGVHPYWSSLRPPGDKYWATVNDLRSEAVRVPRRTLDSLVAEAGLPAPYLLILDVQGAELQVLRGATATLSACAAVSPETALEDFPAVH